MIVSQWDDSKEMYCVDIRILNPSRRDTTIVNCSLSIVNESTNYLHM